MTAATDRPLEAARDDVPPAMAIAVDEAPVSAESLERLGEVDRQSRIGRTAGQIGIGSGAVVLMNYVSSFPAVAIDLDPRGPGTDMPALVASVVGAMIAGAAAWVMNRRPKA